MSGSLWEWIGRTDSHTKVRYCIFTGCSFMGFTWNTALLFIMAHSHLCFPVRICLRTLRKRYSSFDLLTPNILSLDLNPATLCSPSALHNSSSSLSRWSCQIIVWERSAKTKKQGLHIITAIIVYPQIPITSLSWSPLMTISTLSVSALYLQLSPTQQLQQGKASCLHRSQNNET